MPGQLAGLPNWLRPSVEHALRDKNLDPDDVEQCELASTQQGIIDLTLTLQPAHDLKLVNVTVTLT